MSALTEVYLADAWSRIERIVRDLARQYDLNAEATPMIVAAPTGTYEAVALATNTFEYAMVFDSNLHCFATCVFSEIGKLLVSEANDHFEVRINEDPKNLSLLPQYDEVTSWIGRQLAQSIIGAGSIWADLDHLIRSQCTESTFGSIALRGFISFLLAHEYGHIAYGHHEALRKVKESAESTDEGITNAAHTFEFQADQFAMTAISNVLQHPELVYSCSGPPEFEKLAQQLYLFGAASFFFITEAKSKLVGDLKGLAIISGKLSDEHKLEDKMAYLFNVSKTHPPAQSRHNKLAAPLSPGFDFFRGLGGKIFTAAADKAAEHLYIGQPNAALKGIALSDEIIERFHLSKG